MKNNHSLIVNIVLAVAVVVLFILHFMGKSDEINPVSVSKTTIAYVNSDSLWEKYELVKEIRAELDTFDKRLQGEYNVKATAFQTKYQDFMKKAQAGLLSQNEQEKQGTILGQEQQQIQQLDQELTKKLQQKSQELNAKAQDSILSFLRRYNKKANYTYILQYTKGSTVLVANDSLEITKPILDGLNKEYKKSK